MTETAPHLLILRHAHSSWALPGQRDHQRTLDDRGRMDAQKLANRLAEQQITIDIAYCSTATRARETFEIVKPAFSQIGRIVFSDELYAMGPEAYLAAAKAEVDAKAVLLIGHNPMIEDFVLSLVSADPEASQKLLQGFPTCGFAEVVASVGFADFENGRARLEQLLWPRDAG